MEHSLPIMDMVVMLVYQEDLALVEMIHSFQLRELQVREISLSYDIKPSFLEKYVKNVRFSLIGRNLFTLTTYPGFDPESVKSDPSKGVDSNAFRFDSNDSYPLYKMFSGSLAVTF